MLEEFDAAVALGNDGDGWEESAVRQTELRGKRLHRQRTKRPGRARWLGRGEVRFVPSEPRGESHGQ
jgi:hypothetical protein